MRTKKQRYIYFIESADKIKIGIADNVAWRMADIANMSPVPVRLLGFIEGDEAAERALHVRFAHLRRHGEWFTASDELRTYIDNDPNVLHELRPHGQAKRMSFSLEDEYQSMLRLIAEKNGRTQTEELRILINMRAIAVGIDPVRTL